MFLSLRHISLLFIATLLVSTLSSAQVPTPSLSLLLVSDASAGKVLILTPEAAVPIHAITLPFAVHERVWHSADQRYAYLSSPDGWVIKFDMQSQRVAQQLRVGQSTSGLALSGDGRFIMVANLQPATLVAIDTNDLSILRTINAKDKAGKASAVAAISTAAARQSFIAVMRDIPELWELSYDAHAEPVYEGLVHDYQMSEAIALRGPFPPRRTVLEQKLSSFMFDTSFTQAIGASDDGLLQIIHLDIRRKIRDIRFTSKLQADAGVSWQWQGKQILALPQATEKLLNLLDMQSWQVLHKIAFSGEHIRLHTHANARYVWVESKDEDTASTEQNRQLLDKQTLAMLTVIPPLIATSSAPLAWISDGQIAVVKSGDKMALLLINTTTLALVDRLELPQ